MYELSDIILEEIRAIRPPTNLDLQKVMFLVYLNHKDKYNEELFNKSLIKEYRHGVVIKPIYDKYKHESRAIVGGKPKGNISPRIKDSIDETLDEIKTKSKVDLIKHTSKRLKEYQSKI